METALLAAPIPVANLRGFGPGMARHRPLQRRPRTKGRRARTLRVRVALHTPPDLRVLAEALIDLAYDAANEADTKRPAFPVQ